MAGVPQTAVTPAGIRDGDPAALRGLVARRGAAVLAFCDAVCTPEDAVLATAEAFARFRAAVAAADDPGGLAPEPLLLSATRHAAAALARPAVPSGVRGRIGRRREVDPLCPRVPALLAMRADDMLGPADLDLLAEHLEADAGCREVEAAFRRAERAYRSPPDRPVEAHVESVVLAALEGAAPVVAPPPADEDGPAPVIEDEPLTAAPVETDDLTAVLVDTPGFEEADDEAFDDGPEALEDEPEALHEEPEPFDEEPEALEDEPFDEEPDAYHEEPAVPEDGESTRVHRWAPAPPAGEPRPAMVAVAPTATAPGRGAPGIPRRPRVHLPHPHVDHGPVFGYVLPAAALAVALIIILAVAGVFGGDGPAPGFVLLPAG